MDIKSVYIGKTARWPVGKTGVRALEGHVYYEILREDGTGVRGFAASEDELQSVGRNLMNFTQSYAIGYSDSDDPSSVAQQQLFELRKKLINAEARITELEFGIKTTVEHVKAIRSNAIAAIDGHMNYWAGEADIALNDLMRNTTKTPRTVGDASRLIGLDLMSVDPNVARVAKLAIRKILIGLISSVEPKVKLENCIVVNWDGFPVVVELENWIITNEIPYPTDEDLTETVGDLVDLKKWLDKSSVHRLIGIDFRRFGQASGHSIDPGKLYATVPVLVGESRTFLVKCDGKPVRVDIQNQVITAAEQASESDNNMKAIADLIDLKNYLGA